MFEVLYIKQQIIFYKSFSLLVEEDTRYQNKILGPLIVSRVLTVISLQLVAFLFPKNKIYLSE
jgi:hypothetical protein